MDIIAVLLVAGMGVFACVGVPGVIHMLDVLLKTLAKVLSI